jgi:dethiobiotin synthetase
MRGFAIAGIGTDVGKTVVSAIITEALEGCYFKPIQAGDLDNSDSIKVKNWCSDKITVAEELFRLTEPMAPHKAAELDGVEIRLSDIEFPTTDQPLILEGAGGVLVPLNEKGETILAIYKKSKLPVIVVSRHYLGSINHTLLTIQALQSAGLAIAGIIYVGDASSHTEHIIEKLTKVKALGRVPIVQKVDSAFIQSQANEFKQLIYELNG